MSEPRKTIGSMHFGPFDLSPELPDKNVANDTAMGCGGAFAVVETITGWEMLVATTHLDLLRHANFKSCARADCGIPFPRLSGHNQIYCGPECAHVVAQRATRERKKKEENHPQSSRLA